MKEYTCIVCPNGCSLHYDETTGKCTGNRCPRGAAFADGEFHHPMRTLCTTLATDVPGYPVISVRTSREIPKELVFQAIAEINKAKIHDYLPINSVVIHNILNTGADIITTAPMVKGN